MAGATLQKDYKGSHIKGVERRWVQLQCLPGNEELRLHFTVVFDEPVSGFTDSDVTLSGTAGATTASVSQIAPNNGTTYDVAVSGMTSGGTVGYDRNGFVILAQEGLALGQQVTIHTGSVGARTASNGPFLANNAEVSVAQKQSLTLNLGSYDTLTVGQQATIIFTGGLYTFREWSISQKANLVFQAASEIRIAGRISLGQQVDVTGALMGRWVDVAQKAQLTLDSSSSVSGSVSAASLKAARSANATDEATDAVDEQAPAVSMQSQRLSLPFLTR